MLETLVHIVLWSSKCDNVTLLTLVRECNLYLIKSISDTLDSLPFCSNHQSVEPLFYKNVLGLLIFLKMRRINVTASPPKHFGVQQNVSEKLTGRSELKLDVHRLAYNIVCTDLVTKMQI